MKKRLINLCLVFVFIGVIYIFVNKYEYADLLKPKAYLQIALGIDITLPLKDNNIVEMKTSELKENNELQQYYGTYEIIEFWPTLPYYRGLKADRLAEQEADMMLGHIVEIKEDSLVTYECFRWNVLHDGRRVVWSGNYQIEKVSMGKNAYEWEHIDSASTSLEEFTGRLRESFPCTPEFENCREKICGRITVTVEAPYVQEFYVMEDGIMMFSTMTWEYFYLKKLDTEPDKVMATERLSEEEKEKIIQSVYGNYTITEFLPTKFYPTIDSAGDILTVAQSLPETVWEEKITYEEQVYLAAFERISPAFETLSDLYGGYADYQLVVKDENGNIVSSQILTNYPITLEEVYWFKDISGDDFPDVILCSSYVEGNGNRFTELIFYIWNNEKLVYESKPLPWDKSLDGPVWNEELSSIIFAYIDDEVNMEMFIYRDGEWSLSGKCAVESETEKENGNIEFVCGEYFYKDNQTIKNKIKVTVPEQNLPWHDDNSIWGGTHNVQNEWLFPSCAGWKTTDKELEGGKTVWKYTRNDHNVIQ